MCPYSAGQKSTLNYHVKAVHDLVKDQKCDKCQYSATQKSALISHIKRVHKIGSTSSGSNRVRLRLSKGDNDKTEESENNCPTLKADKPLPNVEMKLKDNDNISCILCPLEFDCAKSYNEHLKSSHIEDLGRNNTLQKAGMEDNKSL